MTEEIYAIASGVARPAGTEEALLRLLCREAEQRLRRQAGERWEACREAALCAAALLAAAGLWESRGGSGGVERFSVGEVSVTTGSGGSAADRLRLQAERMMAPYCAGGGFAFMGVRG